MREEVAHDDVETNYVPRHVFTSSWAGVLQWLLHPGRNGLVAHDDTETDLVPRPVSTSSWAGVLQWLPHPGRNVLVAHDDTETDLVPRPVSTSSWAGVLQWLPHPERIFPHARVLTDTRSPGERGSDTRFYMVRMVVPPYSHHIKPRVAFSLQWLPHQGRNGLVAHDDTETDLVPRPVSTSSWAGVLQWLPHPDTLCRFYVQIPKTHPPTLKLSFLLHDPCKGSVIKKTPPTHPKSGETP